MSENTNIPVEVVDPAKVPQLTLYTGARMPGVGIGTFGSDRFSPEDVANAVEDAVKSAHVKYGEVQSGKIDGTLEKIRFDIEGEIEN